MLFFKSFLFYIKKKYLKNIIKLFEINYKILILYKYN